jgi:hypothetical protein
MVDLISKGVDMAGAEIQLTHANVVMMVLVGVHGVSSGYGQGLLR